MSKTMKRWLLTFSALLAALLVMEGIRFVEWAVYREAYDASSVARTFQPGPSTSAKQSARIEAYNEWVESERGETDNDEPLPW